MTLTSTPRLLTRVLREQWGARDCLVCSDGGNMVASLYFGFHTATSVADAGVQVGLYPIVTLGNQLLNMIGNLV